jgi:hypothetical protein
MMQNDTLLAAMQQAYFDIAIGANLDRHLSDVNEAIAVMDKVDTVLQLHGLPTDECQLQRKELFRLKYALTETIDGKDGAEVLRSLVA